MEAIGILLKKVGLREGVSSKNGQPWKTAEFLLEIPGNYVRHIKLDVRDGQAGRIDRFDSMIGKTVKVSFDIDAHEYQGRWYNEIVTWGIMEYIAGQQIPKSSAVDEPAPTNGDPSAKETNQDGEKDDDLPF